MNLTPAQLRETLSEDADIEFLLVRPHRPRYREDGREELFQISLLDEVFDEFLSTNVFRSRNFALPDLLQAAGTAKKFLRYFHCGIPYLATVFTVQSHDGDWINIKLCHNGFQYKPQQGRHYSRHQSEGWVSLGHEAVATHLSKTKKHFHEAGYAEEDGCKLALLCNYQQQQVDVKITPAGDDHSRPRILLTFESGYPDYDDE
jgi:hypothetical protein